MHFVRMVDHASGNAREFTPADDIPAVARALAERLGVRLVILDPILAIAAGARDSYRPEDVRKCLLPIQALTRGRGVAVLGITHFLKRHNSTGSDPLDRVIGSQAWSAVARIVWAVDKLDTGGRGLMLAKSNLGSSAGGYTYELVEELLPTDDPPAAAVAGLTVRFPGTLDGEAADVFRTVPVNPRDKDWESVYRHRKSQWIPHSFKKRRSERVRKGQKTAGRDRNGWQSGWQACAVGFADRNALGLSPQWTDQSSCCLDPSIEIGLPIVAQSLLVETHLTCGNPMFNSRWTSLSSDESISIPLKPLSP